MSSIYIYWNVKVSTIKKTVEYEYDKTAHKCSRMKKYSYIL